MRVAATSLPETLAQRMMAATKSPRFVSSVFKGRAKAVLDLLVTPRAEQRYGQPTTTSSSRSSRWAYSRTSTSTAESGWHPSADFAKAPDRSSSRPSRVSHTIDLDQVAASDPALVISVLPSLGDQRSWLVPAQDHVDVRPAAASASVLGHRPCASPPPTMAAPWRSRGAATSFPADRDRLTERHVGPGPRGSSRDRRGGRPKRPDAGATERQDHARSNAPPNARPERRSTTLAESQRNFSTPSCAR
mgnify:CR=1 FL=1